MMASNSEAVTTGAAPGHAARADRRGVMATRFGSGFGTSARTRFWNCCRAASGRYVVVRVTAGIVRCCGWIEAGAIVTAPATATTAPKAVTVSDRSGADRRAALSRVDGIIEAP